MVLSGESVRGEKISPGSASAASSENRKAIGNTYRLLSITYSLPMRKQVIADKLTCGLIQKAFITGGTSVQLAKML